MPPSLTRRASLAAAVLTLAAPAVFAASVGSGDLRLRDLAADDVMLALAGSGDASVTAARTLAVSIAGSGEVDYGGGAVLSRSRIAGNGSVRQRP